MKGDANLNPASFGAFLKNLEYYRKLTDFNTKSLDGIKGRAKFAKPKHKRKRK